MKIRYLGHSCFYIVGDEKSVVLDPFSGVGFPLEKVKCDYCCVSHNHFDHNFIDGVEYGKVIRSSSDGFLTIDTFHDSALGKERGKNSAFKFSVDGVTFCHLGDLGEYYSQSLVEEIGEVDVLFIPVGGVYTIDYKEAVKFASAIKAKITVPMHYKTKRSSIDVDGVENFVKRMTMVESVEREIEFSEIDLPTEPSVYRFDDSEF